jgi:hypothetical protein
VAIRGVIERRAGPSIASDAPNTSAIASNIHSLGTRPTLTASNVAAHTARPTRNSAVTWRRSNRSAAHPLTSTRATEGTNWASPSRPIVSSSPVTSYACLNSTVTRMLTPSAAHTVETR